MENAHPKNCGYVESDAELCWVFRATARTETQLPSSLTEAIAGCLKCPTFEEAIRRSTGRRKSDQLLTLTLHRLLGQLVDYDTELVTITNSLQRKVEELAVLKSVSEALLKTPDLKKALLITLTGVTSGEAFGFNRAMIFLVNAAQKTLDGQIGLGHLDFTETARVWGQLSAERVTFEGLIDKILTENEIPNNQLTQAIAGISIPLKSDYGLLPQAVLDKKSINIESTTEEMLVDQELTSILKGIPFVIVPIITELNVLGVILVDNSVTRQPITSDDVRTLETLANQAASKIENALLHQQLEVRYAELEHIHSLLKENQEYLIKSEPLVDLGRLATTVAHEIKTPLITIGGYAQRVLRKAENGKINPSDLQIIYDEILRLERICERILDYSQKSPLQLKQNDLNVIISETLRLEESKLRYQNITFETQFYPERLEVLSDEDRLKQVLFNLIQNAAEAMINGGKIFVRTGRENQYIYFQIRDSGCGMDEQTLSKLFTPFFTKKRKGTGLGLPVSKKIIDDHGGSIRVESRPMQGSTFTVSLPTRTG